MTCSCRALAPGDFQVSAAVGLCRKRSGKLRATFLCQPPLVVTPRWLHPSAGVVGVVLFSRFVSSVSIICCLPQCADSKTDGGQSRFVDRPRLGHLQEQRFH